MNRRSVMAGAAALATVVVLPPLAAQSEAETGGASALEFARLVAECTPEQKIAYAAMLRALPDAPEAVRIMADVIECWGKREAKAYPLKTARAG